ncbi:C4-dicarboxylate transporter DctA [Embleya scabrispora]|uniref:C4-dicarboxylate transporter DctA n=1 Tax=Embleya scabrispora TaxID=159449 RepID=A0A1T3NQV0_9ACTN|nr:C4-dicarboxylate transporter DctA [Embleya scabrispora]OPC79168.1 C4-dicarboxylate transporter DctA [Embleya scabrispora]
MPQATPTDHDAGTPGTPPTPPPARRPWYTLLYVWVLLGILAGVGVGAAWPGTGESLRPLGDTFVNAIRMVITPIIFVTVVTGIAGVDSLRGAGRIGWKSLVYFEALTTIALLLGLVVMNVLRPGDGVHADVGSVKVSATAQEYIDKGEAQSWWHFLTDLVPSSVVGAFAEGDVLRVLFFAVLFGVAIKLVGPAATGVAVGVEKTGHVLFAVLRVVMYAAPVGAFGAMAFTVGRYGLDTLTSLGKLVAIFYGTSLFFVVVVLGAVLAAIRLNILRLLRYMKDELLIVLGTSSSESVLPRVITKMENLGVPRRVAGLTVPGGYSFNLDGTCIYLTLAALYVAQATDTPLSLGQQLSLIAVLLLTSKGAAGVTGSGFVVLAATLSTVGHVPVAGIMLVFGIDRFMSECRALTNVCGNSVASLVVASWEGVLDRERARMVLAGATPIEPTTPPEPASTPEPAASPPALVSTTKPTPA